MAIGLNRRAPPGRRGVSGPLHRPVDCPVLRPLPALADSIVEAAACELLSHAQDIVPCFRSAYILGVEWRPERLPRLAQCLDRVAGDVGEPDLVLSFARASLGMPPARDEGYLFQGLHLDTHPGLRSGIELFRVLVNLATAPRVLLWREGEDVPLRSFTIPGRDQDAVYAVDFWASRIEHVGREAGAPVFLASFEALRIFPPLAV